MKKLLLLPLLLAAVAARAADSTADLALKEARDARKVADRTELVLTGASAAGAACASGTKTIFFDLGNDAFREDTFREQAGARARTARVGGNLASGLWAAGCVDPTTGRFREERVKEDESVRLVLLNARQKTDYSVLLSGGALQPSETISLARLEGGGPICGDTGTECDVDASELDALLAELARGADALQRVTDRRPEPRIAGALAARSARCVQSLGRAEDCRSFDPVHLATGAAPEWWPEFDVARARFAGSFDRFDRQRAVLCAKWAARIDAYNARYDPRVVREISQAIHGWAADASRRMKSYADVRQLLAILRDQPAALQATFAAFEPRSVATTVNGIAAWRETESYHYYRSNGQRFCATDPSPDPAFLETTHAAVNREVADALFRYRDAAALLDHAYSARVFGLRPMGGNTAVLVTVYAAPSAGPAAPAAAPAGTSSTASAEPKEAAGDSAPVAYQFTYPVETVRRLSFSFGTAAALHPRYDRDDPWDWVSPEPRPLVFLNWALYEDGANLIHRWGLQAGVPLSDARRILSGDDPGKVDLYFGLVAWPVPMVALSAGLVDSFSARNATQLGFYLGASADLLAVLDAWKGPKKVLAQ